MPLSEEQRRTEEKEWQKTLHRVLSKQEISGSGLAYVMETPLVMELVGAEHLPVYILESKKFGQKIISPCQKPFLVSCQVNYPIL